MFLPFGLIISVISALAISLLFLFSPNLSMWIHKGFFEWKKSFPVPSEFSEGEYCGDCIKTFKGHYMNVFEPTVDMVDIDDMAHAGAQIPRFGGHLKKKITLNQHQVMMARRAKSLRVKNQCIVHDGSETYMCDFPSPIKRRFPEYKKVEDNLLKVICEALHVEYPFDPEVKRLDMEQLDIERNLKPHQIWGEKRAKTEYLKMFNKLTK